MRLTFGVSALAALALIATATAAQAGAVKKPPPAVSKSSTSSSDVAWDVGNRVLNQTVNRFAPTPPNILGGYAFGGMWTATANVLYAAIRTSIVEGRELGNGEACAIIFDGLSPIPFSVFAKPCYEAWAKRDLCKEKEWRNYPGLRNGDRTSVPMAAYDSWYLEQYCDGPVEHRYDVFMAAAGKPPRSAMASAEPKKKSLRQAAKQTPRRVADNGYVYQFAALAKARAQLPPWPSAPVQAYNEYRVLYH